MRLLVCGTRNAKLYDYNGYSWFETQMLIVGGNPTKITQIIEGCCLNSADKWAERWAKQNHIKVSHHPSTPGNYLKRNLEMLKECDEVLAFWSGFSYGTSFVIARAVEMKKPVHIVKLGDW